MSITAQERQAIEQEFGRRSVDEACTVLDPVARKNIPASFDVANFRALMEAHFDQRTRS